MNFAKIIFFIILIFIISSCKQYISQNELIVLKPGMDTSLVKRYFNKISPRCTAGTNIFGDSSVFVEIYILKKGETYSSYFLAYKKGKLLFSGFPYEFISNDDSLINSIGNKTSEYYEKNCD